MFETCRKQQELNLDINLKSAFCWLTLYKSILSSFIFHKMFRPHILTIVIRNAGTAGRVLQTRPPLTFDLIRYIRYCCRERNIKKNRQFEIR